MWLAMPEATLAPGERVLGFFRRWRGLAWCVCRGLTQVCWRRGACGLAGREGGKPGGVGD